MLETAQLSVAASEPAEAPDMAALLAGRLCHDFISPITAIVSGLDLLDDPSAQDMRDDAMGLIASSAHKLSDLLQFARVAYGASSATQTFDTRQLKALSEGVFGHHRAELDWQVSVEELGRVPARALLNMALIGAHALPLGGIALVKAAKGEGGYGLSVEANGNRPRLKPEVLAGLRGEPLSEGLSGQWVQGAYLHQIVHATGGRLAVEVTETRVTLVAFTSA